MFDFSSHHRIPQFSVVIITQDKQKKDITRTVNDRLISLQLTENRGFEADTLDLQLSDHDGKLALPPRNAEIELAIGWKGQPLIPKGRYVVDEVQFSGSPDTLSIRARSADLKGSLSSQKERSFHQMKLEALVGQIAAENGLKSRCDTALAEQVIDHLDQTNESDINLLSRLAEQFGAMATVKNGALLFLRLGQGKTASGQPLPSQTIRKSDGDNYQFSITESANYKAVRAYWHDTDTGKRGEVVIDDHTQIHKQAKMTKGRKLKSGKVKGQRLSKRKYTVLEQTQPVTSDSSQMKTLRHTYASEKAAITGAKSAFDRLKRGVATFSITLAYGNPELMPEVPISLEGFKGEIDSTQWLVSKVTHDINSGGYISQVECELKIENR